MQFCKIHPIYRYAIVNISHVVSEQPPFCRSKTPRSPEPCTQVPFRLPCPRRGKSAVRSLQHRRETFHPDFAHTRRASEKPAGASALFFFFLRVPVTLRSPAEKASADDGRVYTIVCTVVRAHILAPISHRLPSSMWTCSRDTHTCTSERAATAAASSIHAYTRLANRFPAWVEYIEIIWANTTSSVMKFAEGLASSLDSPVSASPPRSHPLLPIPLAPVPFLAPLRTPRCSFTSCPRSLPSSSSPLAPSLYPASRISPRPASSDICSKSVQ